MFTASQLLNPLDVPSILFGKSSISNWLNVSSALLAILSYSLPAIKSAWDQETVDAERRRQEHWREVQAKQADVRRLRTEISELELGPPF